MRTGPLRMAKMSLPPGYQTVWDGRRGGAYLTVQPDDVVVWRDRRPFAPDLTRASSPASTTADRLPVAPTGTQAFRVLQAVDAGADTSFAVAALTGLSTAITSAHLSQLAAKGLVERVGSVRIGRATRESWIYRRCEASRP